MEQSIEVPANDIQVPTSTAAATLDDASLLLLDPQLQALTSEPAASPPILLDQPVAATLNADAINASTEQEHIQHAQIQEAIEGAIVQADANAKADSDIAVEPILEDSASKQVKEEKLEETVMNLLREDIRDMASTNAANATAAPVTESIDVEEGDGQGSGSSDLSTEAIEPSVNGNADTSGSGRDRSTSAHPGGENAERGDTPSHLPASQPITTKGRSASANSSTMTATSRPQRRTASSAKKAEKDTPPLSASSRTSSRRATNGKDRDLAGASSEKPSSSVGGTARTRGLAQKAQDKAEKDMEKQRRSSRPRAKKGDSSRSLQDLEDLENEEEEEDQGDGEAQGAEDDGDDGITRCICGNNEDDAPGFMIMCETCKAWQHGPCMGFKVENECPDTYYCELCRPDLHPKVHGTASSSSGRTTSKRGHGRTVSSSSRVRGTSRDVSVKEDLAASSSSMARPPLSRDRESSASVPPPSATSISHPPHHRSRASADAAVIQSFMDSNRSKGQASPSPSPASPGGTPGSGPLAADGKRPMYPPTSHLSAPALPKRRSTMNSRESAAFDESIMLANVNAFKESRLMASSSSSGDHKRKRKKKEDSEGLDREDSLTMEAVKEEDEDDEEGAKEDGSQQDQDISASSDMPSGKRLKLDPAASVEPSAPAEAPDADHQGDETVIEHMEVDDVPEEATIDESGVQEDVLEDGQDAPGTGPKKRRRRRGPGATAPVRKKTPAKPRATRPRTALEIATNSVILTEGEDTEGPETPATATAANFEGSLGGEEGEEALPPVVSPAANRSARKRKSMAADEEIPTVVLQAAQGQAGRAVSPSASVVTADSSNSSDKPLAQQALPAVAAVAEASSNGLQRTVSAQDMSNGTAKDASGRVNLMPPSAVARGKRPAKGQLTAEEAEEDHDSERATTPAPFAFLSPADTAPVSTSGTTSRGGKAGTRGRGGGPGSRGGKHSPHKRGGFAGVDGRKGHKDRDDTPGAFDDFSNQPPTWNLPDHLHHLAHLLPSPNPNPLSVPAYVHTPQVSSAPSPTEAALNGPAAEQGAASSSASTSSSGASVQQQLPPPVKHLEPCAKVRFPPRRVSMTEMKKRAKHVLDYLGRIQMDMVERNNRSRALGIAAASPPASAVGSASGSESQTPQSAALLDDLSRQLINFQEKFT